MARVHAKRTAAPVRTGTLRHGKTNEQRKPSYKVIFEEMTERKKKLHTTLSFKTEAPPGYTFIAAGDPRLTSKCKEISRSQALAVYIVSLLGLTMAKSGNVHYDEEQLHLPTRRSRRSAQQAHTKGKQNSKPRAASAGMDMDQSEIDARASFAIKDLFPKIPNQDVQHIVAQAFQKGKSRVGTAVDQPFIRRVHLAVGAYIRHTYTDYDKLLKSHSYLDARAIVQPYTLDKIIEWRDEKDEPDAVEDILREVIIISDDDEEEVSHDDVASDRESSIEVISSHEIANKVQGRSLDYSTLDERFRLERPPSSEDAWAPSVKFIRRLSTPPSETARRRQAWADRQQAQRNRVWQEAISRRRNRNQAVPDKNTKSAERPYTQLEAVMPLQRYAQPMDATRIEQQSWPGLTETRDIYADHGVDQSSVVVTERRWDHEADDRISLGALRPRQGLDQVHFTLSGRTVTCIPRQRHQVDGVNEIPSTERPAVQHLSGISQRPAIARSIHLDSERPIPSVESDPHAQGRQEPPPRGTKPSNSDSHLPDRFTGPRIIELHDGETSPAQKRRRVEDDLAPSSKVMYRPKRDQASSTLMSFGPNQYNEHLFPEARPSGLANQKRSQYDQGASRLTEIAPNIGHTHHFAPFDKISQRGSNDTAREKHATYASTGMRFEYEQQLFSPAWQPQPRFSENFPPEPNSRSNVYRFMPPSDMHEPRTFLRPQFTTPSPSSHTNRPHYVGVRQSNQSRDRGFQEAPVRVKLLEPVDQTVERHAYVKPAFDRAYEGPARIPSSATGIPNHTLEPARQSHEHREGMIQISPRRKTDCPEGAQGSFCNRVGENGFTRMDHLDEHLRKKEMVMKVVRIVQGTYKEVATNKEALIKRSSTSVPALWWDTGHWSFHEETMHPMADMVAQCSNMPDERYGVDGNRNGLQFCHDLSAPRQVARST
ncbi:MAG: hypothetical protein Q9211_003007 [Gyalolechia sp. 1 TL-2023]